MPSARRPLVRWLKNLTVLSLGLVTVLAGLLWLALAYSPTTLITPIVSYAAKQQGFELQKLDLGDGWLKRLNPDLIGLRLESLSLASIGLQSQDLGSSDTALELTDVSLEFKLTDALQGRFESLSISELELTTGLAAKALSQTQQAQVQMRALLHAAESEPGAKLNQAPIQSALAVPSDSNAKYAAISFYLARANEVFAALSDLPIASTSIDNAQLTLVDVTKQTVGATATASAFKIDSTRAAARFTAALSDDNGELSIAASGSSELNFADGVLVSGILDVSLEASAPSQAPPRVQLNLNLAQIALDCSAKDQCQAQAQVSAELRGSSTESPAVSFKGIEASELGIDFFAQLSESAERLALHATQLRATLASLRSEHAQVKLRLEIPDLKAELDGTWGVGASFTLQAEDLALPGMQAPAAVIVGEFSLQGLQAELKLALALAERDEALMSLALRHSLTSASGSAELAFNSPALSPEAPLSDVIDLPALGIAAGSADLLAGNVSGNAALAWQQNDSAEWELDGDIVSSFTEISGFYSETLFVDAASEVAAEFDLRLTPTAQGEWKPRIALRSAAPARLSIASIDTGFVLQRASAVYEFTANSDFSTTRYDLAARNLRAGFLGGEVAMAAIAVNERAVPESFDLVLSGVDLGAVVELASYPELIVEGSVSGYLPLRLAADHDLSAVTVSEGLISALKPGGSIRYSPLNAVTANQSLGLVNEALANYQFSTLDTTLDIAKDGEIELGVVLAGANPDMNGGQAINLNVNISDNLVDLLASLRASRELTEELEQRLQRD